ncbi:heme-binding protein [bacterium]|nr:heme-binding protein [bacterium]
MSLYSIIGIVVVGGLFLWSATAYWTVRGIEEPAYTVIEKRKGYELRKYNSYIIATARVRGTYREALNQGFRIIAGYIFGGNTKREGIAMTAPVQESSSEQIAMTVPVKEEGSDTERSISFVMPKQYTLATLPKPNDDRVKLTEVQARTMAVLSYSWWAYPSRVESKKQELITLLQRDSVQATGTVEAAFYNPPFTPPFMQRHEVMVEVVR